MTITRDGVLAVLAGIACPGGGDLVSRDLVRALVVDGGSIRFVIEAASPDEARSLAPVQTAAETALRALPGVTSVQVVMTAHGPTAKPPPPDLKNRPASRPASGRTGAGGRS